MRSRKKITFFNYPHALINIEGSSACLRALGRYLSKKYEKNPEANIENSDLRKDAEDFAREYRGGMVITGEETGNICRRHIYIQEVPFSSANRSRCRKIN